MKTSISYDASDLSRTLGIIYSNLYEAAYSAAIGHVNTIQNNCEAHFDHTIEHINEAVKQLWNFYPITDSRRDKSFPLFIKEDLIKQAKSFLETELY